MNEKFILKQTYALNRHIKDMERGFTIKTNYGDLEVDSEEAKAFIVLTQKMLEKRIKNIGK